MTSHIAMNSIYLLIIHMTIITKDVNTNYSNLPVK